MIPFVDIHTHQPSFSQSVVEVINILPFEEVEGRCSCFSAGVHPWYVDHDQMEAYQRWLVDISSDTRCLMIGEAGLDGACSIDGLLQDKVFQLQIDLSGAMQKPLVLHCVRRYNEMIVLSDLHPGHPPWILHGFQSSVEMVHHLRERNFFFSFGAALLRPNPKLVASLRAIPIDRLLFETDDSGLPIGQIYLAAAGLLDFDVVQLKEMVFNNFKQVFNVDKLA